MSKYAQARIGATEHYTTDLDGQGRPTYAARTLCGKGLAGTPESPAAESYCSACQDLLPCDECHHKGTSHLNAWAEREAGREEAAEYIFAQATCWAENICQECQPALHNDALARGLGATREEAANV
jgi:hypothetical protein